MNLIFTLTKSFGNHPSDWFAVLCVSMASYCTRPHHHGPGSTRSTSTSAPFSKHNSCGPPALKENNTSAYTRCGSVVHYEHEKKTESLMNNVNKYEYMLRYVHIVWAMHTKSNLPWVNKKYVYTIYTGSGTFAFTYLRILPVQTKYKINIVQCLHTFTGCFRK